jgi:hypothetical protein
MPEDKERKIITSPGGIFNDLATRIKLIIRLITDPRVSPFLKLLPLGSVLYFLIPDLLPGPVDDVAIIWLGAFLFVELCPPDVVQEHIDALEQVVPGEWRDSNGGVGKVVDAEFWESENGGEEIIHTNDPTE